MTRATPRRRWIAVAALLAATGVARAHHTPTAAERAPTDASAVRQAASVVAGRFAAREELTFTHLEHEGGTRKVTERVTRLRFQVEELIDGLPVPEVMDFYVEHGADVALPPDGARVVVGAARLRGAFGGEGYVIVHYRVWDAASDAKLAELRSWARTSRIGATPLDTALEPEDEPIDDVDEPETLEPPPIGETVADDPNTALDLAALAAESPAEQPIDDSTEPRPSGPTDDEPASGAVRLAHVPPPDAHGHRHPHPRGYAPDHSDAHPHGDEHAHHAPTRRWPWAVLGLAITGALLVARRKR